MLAAIIAMFDCHEAAKKHCFNNAAHDTDIMATSCKPYANQLTLDICTHQYHFTIYCTQRRPCIGSAFLPITVASMHAHMLFTEVSYELIQTSS